MRKLLLASAAVAIMGGPAAYAADSETVQVTASVLATCSLTDPNDVSFGTNPAIGANATSNFSFTCNFAGDGGEGALHIGFQSANGGLNNPADGTPRSYTMAYNGNPAVTAASLFGAPTNYPETSGAANVANPRSFVVTLASALPVAGAYADTLTVNVAP